MPSDSVHSWPARTVTDLAELRDATLDYTLQGHGPFKNFAFRGQANIDWPLHSTIARELEHYKARHNGRLQTRPDFFEMAVMRSFRQRAHLFLKVDVFVSDDSPIDWLVLGRHYGLPTKVLDWTYSPYVAAYWASCTLPDRDGAVWRASRVHVHAKVHEDGLEEREYLLQLAAGHTGDGPGVMFFDPRVHNVRSAQQQGLFSIVRDCDEDHGEVLLDPLTAWPDLATNFTHEVLRIPAAAKSRMLRELRTMNISEASLSPDLDGFCRDLRIQLREHPGELADYYRQAVDDAREQM